MNSDNFFRACVDGQVFKYFRIFEAIRHEKIIFSICLLLQNVTMNGGSQKDLHLMTFQRDCNVISLLLFFPICFSLTLSPTEVVSLKPKSFNCYYRYRNVLFCSQHQQNWCPYSERRVLFPQLIANWRAVTAHALMCHNTEQTPAAARVHCHYPGYTLDLYPQEHCMLYPKVIEFIFSCQWRLDSWRSCLQDHIYQLAHCTRHECDIRTQHSFRAVCEWQTEHHSGSLQFNYCSARSSQFWTPK